MRRAVVQRYSVKMRVVHVLLYAFTRNRRWHFVCLEMTRKPRLKNQRLEIRKGSVGATATVCASGTMADDICATHYLLGSFFVAAREPFLTRVPVHRAVFVCFFDDDEMVIEVCRLSVRSLLFLSLLWVLQHGTNVSGSRH